jgi:thymidylate synthase
MFKAAIYINHDNQSMLAWQSTNMKSYISGNYVLISEKFAKMLIDVGIFGQLLTIVNKVIVKGNDIQQYMLTRGKLIDLMDRVHCFNSFNKIIEYYSAKNVQTIWTIGGNDMINSMVWKGLIMDVHIMKNYSEYNKFESINFNRNLLLKKSMNFTLVSTLNNRSIDNSITKHFMRRNYEENSILSSMSTIIINGFKQPNRTGVDTLMSFGKMFEYNMTERIDPITKESYFQIPMLTTKKIYTKGVFEELKWFLGGCVDSKELEEKNVNIWKGNTSRTFLDSRNLGNYQEGETGPIYGFQWRHWGADYFSGKKSYDDGIDQVDQVVKSLKTNPFSRRHIISGWNVADLDKMCLPPCFPTGTLVLTKKGYKQIQTIDDHDLVFTHTSSWQPIVNRQERIYDDCIMEIKTLLSSTPIFTTTEHPFLIKEKTKYSWVPSMNLKSGDMVCIPINTDSQLPNINVSIDDNITENNTDIDWFMLGLFVGRIRVLGDESDRYAIPPGWTLLKEFTTNPNSTEILCNTIPEWVQKLPKDIIDDFTRGWLTTAKCEDNNYRVANEIVALQLQRLFAKIGKCMSIQTTDKGFVHMNPIKKNVKFVDNYMCVPIIDINDEHRETMVYNIEVANDNSYVVENVAVHNCHVLYQFSVHEENDQKYLSLMMQQRSCDTFLGMPFNICSLSMFLLMMAHKTNMKPYKIVHSIGDMHIYKNHTEAVKEQLQREPFMFPYARIKSDIKNDLSEYDLKDFDIQDYFCYPSIKADMVA